jgi:hypothetical protein
MRLPEGFTGRIIATSDLPVIEGQEYVWHDFPDGGATYPTANQGYIYVSNSEIPIVRGRSGVGAIRFNRNGDIVDAYPILTGSTWNCSGGATPWGTWLSGEEREGGLVWECDPTGATPGVERPALGLFIHEAVAVDPGRMRLYLTEDASNGRFYRFTPDALDDNGNAILTAGTLEVMRVTTGDTGPVTWLPVPDPSAADVATRLQVPESTAFDGGEGVWFYDDEIYFTTKGDDRIWAHHVVDDTLRVVYDSNAVTDPILTGVDFILATSAGDLLVAEDGGDMQVVAISPSGDVAAARAARGPRRLRDHGPGLRPHAAPALLQLAAWPDRQWHGRHLRGDRALLRALGLTHRLVARPREPPIRGFRGCAFRWWLRSARCRARRSRDHVGRGPSRPRQ